MALHCNVRALIVCSFPVYGYNSPLLMPPTVHGLSPAYYYHYYCNGLSSSYHDLSQLQQQNMMNIMKRSGFVAEDPDTAVETASNKEKKPVKSGSKTNQSKRKVSIAVNQGKSIVKQDSKRSVDTSQRSSTSPQNIDEGGDDDEQGQPSSAIGPSDPLYDASGYDKLERSFSMPAINQIGLGDDDEDDRTVRDFSDRRDGGSGSARPRTGQEATISDEVIHELGMWEQVIQEEKQSNPQTNEQEPQTKSPTNLIVPDEASGAEIEDISEDEPSKR